MKKYFGLSHALILITILTLILAPRPIMGYLDLKAAIHFDQSGNWSQAGQAYVSAAQRIPWMPTLWEKAGKLALQSGEVDNAIALLNQAVTQGAITPEGWLTLGDAYQKRGQLSHAVDAWQKAMPLAPAASSLATAERSLGNFIKAIEYWRISITLEPGKATPHYELGLLLAATEPKQALPELMRADQLNLELDKPVQSLRTALNIAFQSDDEAYQLVVSGRALAALDQWDLAGEAFRRATLKNPDYAEAWAWLGEAKQQLGMDGHIQIDKALSLNPGSTIVSGLYGMYLQRQGQPAAARTAFQKAADLEPGDPVWQMALGSASAQTGDLVAAYGYYLQAVHLAPEDPSTWRALAAFSLAYSVDVKDAGLPAAQKLVGLAPDEWQSYDLAGQAEFLLNDLVSSETYLKKAVLMAPTQAIPALHLGLLYLQSGDRASAYSYLSLAKTFDPNGAAGWQAERLLGEYFP